MTTQANTSPNMSTDTVSQGEIDLSAFVDPTQGSRDISTINPNDLNEAFDQQDRGTADAESAPKDKGETPAKESPTKQPENKSSAPTLEAKESEKVDPSKPRSRAAERLNEVLPKLKTAEQTIAELRAQLAQQKPDAEKKTRIPKPQAPGYTREQLDQLEAHYEAQGDTATLRAVRSEIKKWDKYDNDLRFWTIENGQAEKEYNAHKQHYTAEAVKQWPDLAKEDSEITQHYSTLKNKVIPKDLLGQITEHPMGEYLLASVASLRVSASKVVALEQRNKALEEENAGLKSKQQPLKSSTAQKAGANDSEEDPRKSFVSDLDQALKAKGLA